MTFESTSFVLSFTEITVADTSSIADESSSITADISHELSLALTTLLDTVPTIFSSLLVLLVIFFIISCNVSINLFISSPIIPISSFALMLSRFVRSPLPAFMFFIISASALFIPATGRQIDI